MWAEVLSFVCASHQEGGICAASLGPGLPRVGGMWPRSLVLEGTTAATLLARKPGLWWGGPYPPLEAEAVAATAQCKTSYWTARLRLLCRLPAVSAPRRGHRSHPARSSGLASLCWHTLRLTWLPSVTPAAPCCPPWVLPALACCSEDKSRTIPRPSVLLLALLKQAAWPLSCCVRCEVVVGHASAMQHSSAPLSGSRSPGRVPIAGSQVLGSWTG